MEISREAWLRIFPVLNSEKRFSLLEYFGSAPEKKPYTDVREETGFSDGSLVYHLNLMMSANLLRNSTQKTEIGRHPYSYYEVTDLGREVLSILKT